jgi:cytochrome c oxidase subunit II
MRWLENLARAVALLILVGLPAAIVVSRYAAAAPTAAHLRIVDLTARTPEDGGWSPDRITVNKGDTVRLRITGSDMVHGFAIGQLGIDAGRILPGAPVTVEFVADRPGRYTYYCDVWCSPFHPRMRGTLDVIDPAASAAPPMSAGQSTPTALDIDSPHEADFYPLAAPSAARGRDLAAHAALPVVGDLRRQSPEAVFDTLRAAWPAASRSDGDLWDLVAFLWSAQTTPQRIAAGQLLYTKNCAACHGEAGAANGPGARTVPNKPADFTNTRNMVGGSSERYYAKIRRGGMGTGMPYWGPIFTEDETWSLVDYLWTFSLNRD